MITQGEWSIAPRVGKYQVIPANEEERIALEKIGGITFEALSVGTRKGQVAIIPLDESNRDNANLIAAAPDMIALIEEMLFTAGWDQYGKCSYESMQKAKLLVARIRGDS